MKKMFSICLVLIFGLFLSGIAHADTGILEEQAIEQVVLKLSNKSS